MQLNPAEISELIKNKIQGFDEKTETSTQGSVISVTDGICKIHGLSEAMQGEMLEFPGETYGLALNLERDSVGAVILGDYEHISEGDTVKCTIAATTSQDIYYTVVVGQGATALTRHTS